MASSYSPDAAAQDSASWLVAFRSQRDVALTVPINYVTVPAISLQAACFSHNQYEDAAAQKCLSNLLASGFKRFIADVYWDARRSVWSLCPAEIPASAAPADVSSSAPIVSSTSVQSLATAPISVRDGLLPYDEPAATPLLEQVNAGGTGLLFDRQASSVSSERSATASQPPLSSSSVSTMSPMNSTSTARISSDAPAPTEFPTSGEPLVEIGPYNCTSTLGPQSLASILSGYLRETSTTLEASLTYLILNIHAAAPYSAPTSPAKQPDISNLPSDNGLLGHLLSFNLSSYIYTPSMLESERGSLNQTWQSDQSNLPALGYYTTDLDTNVASTQAGWPAESYMEFRRFLRLIVSFGTCDPQMASYNFSGDEDTIFPLGEITSWESVSTTSSGSVTAGCHFVSDVTTINAETNSSWAITTASNLPNLASNPNTTASIPEIMNLTSCGISVGLNTSLSNTTADTNPLAYLAVAHNTLWSWAPNQPNNSSTIDDDTTNDFRCAALYGTLHGRWSVTDCKSSHQVACRGSTPYAWSISSGLSVYSKASTACPDNTTFAVPRTALENTYLYAAALASSNAGPSSSHDPPIIFLDLNSLDYPDCWVVGANSTCPYTDPNDTDHTKIVVVPTVATVIVFFLALATFFVKCAANRKDLRRGKRRRNMGGWDYEGVPS